MNAFKLLVPYLVGSALLGAMLGIGARVLVKHFGKLGVISLWLGMAVVTAIAFTVPAMLANRRKAQSLLQFWLGNQSEWWAWFAFSLALVAFSLLPPALDAMRAATATTRSSVRRAVLRASLLAMAGLLLTLAVFALLGRAGVLPGSEDCCPPPSPG
jgi:hypothetical protein